jgi:hypothetical protein
MPHFIDVSPKLIDLLIGFLTSQLFSGDLQSINADLALLLLDVFDGPFQILKRLRHLTRAASAALRPSASCLRATSTSLPPSAAGRSTHAAR